jgi:hypothetical protein
MRNSWKFQNRDNRLGPVQHIEFDFLAPDTVEEIFHARRLLEIWTAKARRKGQGLEDKGIDEDILAEEGRKLLTEEPELLEGLTILGENMEHSRRDVVILKAPQAWEAYRQMLVYYGVKNILDWLGEQGAEPSEIRQALAGFKETNWVNIGGQLMPQTSFDRLRDDIRAGRLASWQAIHGAYDKHWQEYPQAKQRHAFATLLAVFQAEEFTADLWNNAIDQAREIQQFICQQTYQSRLKDFENPLRQTTFRHAEEMTAVVGTIDDNSFVKQVRQETTAFERRIASARF